MVKEFEELPSIYQFPIEMQNIILRIQKDAWNASIRWAAEHADWGVYQNDDGQEPYYHECNIYVQEESILKGLIK